MSELLQVGAFEAKTHLPELLRQVRDGMSFTITQRGVAVADLVPTGTQSRQVAADAAQRMRDFMKQGAGARMSASQIKALVNQGRD
jgi:prevent-host-death family protein